MAAAESEIGMKILLSEDRNKPDFNWRTENRLPLVRFTHIEAGFVNTVPIGFLTGILSTGISAFAAISLDLKYFLHSENRFFLTFEAATGRYETEAASQATEFRDFYSNLIFNYRLHTYKLIDFLWGIGGGFTYEKYSIRGTLIENYTSQVKTGGIIRLNLTESILVNLFLYYRFNPDSLVNDSRYLFGASAGVRF
jgi:hypothetical protein